MNRMIRISLITFMLASISLLTASAQTSGAQDQPLGDYARNVRKEKKDTPTKTYDNDNLPSNDKISIIGAGGTDNSQNSPAPSSPSDSAASGSQGDDPFASSQPKTDPNNPDKTVMPKTSPGESPENRQQVYDQWKAQLDGQKQQIDLLSRELDVLQREYKLRQAALYGDAGSRLRNSGAWDKEDADYKAKIAEKQKAVDDAKKQMEDMQEDARKSGVPSSVREDQ